MARNKVQHQKGSSEAEFDRRYGSEEQCRAAVVKWRWPDGFVCPECGGHGIAWSRPARFISAPRAGGRRR